VCGRVESIDGGGHTKSECDTGLDGDGPDFGSVVYCRVGLCCGFAIHRDSVSK
jgi:hypothetical protein